MKTVRLDAELESKLAHVARLTGKPVASIVREAVRRHCRDLMTPTLDRRLADVVGVVSSGGGNSRKTGRAFRRLLA